MSRDLVAAVILAALLVAAPAGGTPLADVWPRIAGDQPGARAGGATAVGDLDGDGIDDLAIGADGCDSGAPRAGCVGVFFGGVWPMGTDLVLADADVLIVGTEAQEGAGAAVSIGGDLDGDGIGDLAVAAPWASAGGASRGRVGLFFASSLVSGATVLLDDADVIIEGARQLTQLGDCLDARRDVDGDGRADLLVGASAATDGTDTPWGAVFVVSGRTSWPATLQIEMDVDPSYRGPRASRGFGEACAAVEDQDGDGIDDLLVGAPLETNSGSGSPVPYAGMAFLLPGGTISPATPADDHPLASWLGTGAYDYLGDAVADVGDVDGSGTGDLAFTAYGHDALGAGTGQVYVYVNDGVGAWGTDLDAGADASVVLTGEVAGAMAGRLVAGVGDLNGDGAGELAVAAPGMSAAAASSGRLYLVDGGPGLVGSTIDLSTAGAWWDGTQGQTIADAVAAGDLTGNGWRELVVGSVRGGDLVPADGCVRVLSLLDPDGDGFCEDAVCDGGLAPGDCDPTDPQAYPGAAEVPYDGVDQDCDGTDLEDVDQDGVVAVEAGGGDCDDGDASIYPGAVDLFCDGVDQDCDGADLADADGDGADADSCGGDDCDDTDATIWPGGPEVADGVDNDCDGLVDEGTELADDDGDGYCESAAACSDGSAPGDCDDADPLVHPGAAESIDGVDDDCDGEVDEDTEVADDDGDGFTELAGDCDDTDAAVYPGAAEDPANGIDDDCDGRVDEVDQPLPTDDDGDGYCESSIGCSDGAEPGDCDDADGTVHPGAEEVPYDGVDQDCDGADLRDADGDGYDAVEVGGTDCDDGSADVHPGRVDLGDGVDQDCDGLVDEDAALFDTVLGGGGCSCETSAPGNVGRTPLALVVAWLLAAVAVRSGRRSAML